jgi:small subunit ribosomal protein S8
MSQVSTDPISDMLTRIRNAMAVQKTEVNIPHSKLKEAVANLLKTNHFISGVSVVDAVVGKTLVVTINSGKTTNYISEITRLSKPGRRHYARANEIPVVKRGRGMVIISTSKGVMTGDDAKKQNIGGELICRVF